MGAPRSLRGACFFAASICRVCKSRAHQLSACARARMRFCARVLDEDRALCTPHACARYSSNPFCGSSASGAFESTGSAEEGLEVCGRGRGKGGTSGNACNRRADVRGIAPPSCSCSAAKPSMPGLILEFGLSPSGATRAGALACTPPEADGRTSGAILVMRACRASTVTCTSLPRESTARSVYEPACRCGRLRGSSPFERTMASTS